MNFNDHKEKESLDEVIEVFAYVNGQLKNDEKWSLCRHCKIF